jgi:Transposase DDE domain
MNLYDYNAALANRESLSIQFDPETQRPTLPTGKRGRQPVFSDAPVQAFLTLKAVFRLPLPQPTGMVASLLELAGLDWPMPDFSTICRRQKTLTVRNHRRQRQKFATEPCSPSNLPSTCPLVRTLVTL